MDLLDISGEDSLQFRFIISDKERRAVWFPHIISALEELKKDIARAKSYVNYMFIRRTQDCHTSICDF